MMVIQFNSGGVIDDIKETESVLPVVILALFFGLLVFMVVSRRGQTQASQPQSVTQNR